MAAEAASIPNGEKSVIRSRPGVTGELEEHVELGCLEMFVAQRSQQSRMIPSFFSQFEKLFKERIFILLIVHGARIYVMVSIIVNKTENVRAFMKNLNVERCMECARAKKQEIFKVCEL